MTLPIEDQSFVIFDLDDTLYKEIDFLKSAYFHIANILEKEINKNIFQEMLALWYQGENVFSVIKDKYTFSASVSHLVFEYRYHYPAIHLREDVSLFINKLKTKNVTLGLITDGRSKTQRNKLKALGIESYFDKILISQEFGSEKPDERNFELFQTKFGDRQFIYIGDNIIKDFIIPNRLGWITIGLKDDGNNIHSQNISVERDFMPTYMCASFSDIVLKFSK